MKRILLFILILAIQLFPQLKELEVKPTVNRGGIPIFRDHPDKAGIIFYTQFDDLKFYSSYGIVEIKGDPAGGKYVVIIEAVPRQTIEVRAPGFKTEMIRLESLQPRDVFYYEVLPKKEEGIGGISELAVTILAQPSDASIFVDGTPVKSDIPVQLSIGEHTLRVEKPGYRSYSERINVTPNNTLFKVMLEQVKLAQVQIFSEPQGAEIRINGDPKGLTDKGLFLYPGQYELNLTKDEYLPVDQNITVSGNEQSDKFRYTLTKNRGYLELTIQPAGTSIRLNGQSTEYKNRYELPPGDYTIEVAKDLYLSYNETVVINRGETVKKQVSLTQNFGTINISTTPPDATLRINGVVKSSKGQFDLVPGTYVIEVTAEKYLSKRDTIVLRPKDIVTQNYSLVKDRGNIRLDVSPPEAVVKLNGERISNYRDLEVKPGQYSLEVTADRHLPFSDKFDVGIGTVITRDVNLVKNTGRLTLTTSPGDVTVLVNKEAQSGKDLELTPGMYEVTVKRETYREETFTVEIKRGDNQRRNIQLQAITGSLQFAVSPFEAEVVLERDGQTVSRWKGMKLFDSLRIGQYDLTAKLKGYKTVRKKVIISENKVASEDITLTPGSDTPESMVLVEGGTFTMGSNDGDSDEKPTHQVTVSSFLIGKYEVTQALWESVMGSNPSYFKGSNRPVETVSWYEMVEFCNKLSEKEGLQKAYTGSGSSIRCDFNANGYRLPTEAEWEYAARGGNKSKGYKYSGSNDLDAVGWYSSNTGSGTEEAGKKAANELGLYDMSGNVWEWCWDWKGEYSSSNQSDPRGPNSGSYRVLRGGSWGNDAELCRVANRSLDPDGRPNYYGFRLARTR